MSASKSPVDAEVDEMQRRFMDLLKGKGLECTAPPENFVHESQRREQMLRAARTVRPKPASSATVPRGPAPTTRLESRAPAPASQYQRAPVYPQAAMSMSGAPMTAAAPRMTPSAIPAAQVPAPVQMPVQTQAQVPAIQSTTRAPVKAPVQAPVQAPVAPAPAAPSEKPATAQEPAAGAVTSRVAVPPVTLPSADEEPKKKRRAPGTPPSDEGESPSPPPPQPRPLPTGQGGPPQQSKPGPQYNNMGGRGPLPHGQHGQHGQRHQRQPPRHQGPPPPQMQPQGYPMMPPQGGGYQMGAPQMGQPMGQPMGQMSGWPSVMPASVMQQQMAGGMYPPTYAMGAPVGAFGGGMMPPQGVQPGPQ